MKRYHQVNHKIWIACGNDINDRFFGVGSVSYAKLSNDSKITVKNANGNALVRSTTKIDVDPIITYLGVGYRF